MSGASNVTGLRVVNEQSDLFSYAALHREDEVALRESAADIKVRLRRSAEDIVAIGQRLIEAKARLEHGQFLPWIEAEFEMSERAARRFMEVGGRYAGKSDIVADLTATALYALAAPSTPQDARSEVEAIVVEGETLTAKRVQEIIERHKTAETKAAQIEQNLRAAERDLEAANRSKDMLTEVEKERARQQAANEVAQDVSAIKAENQMLTERYENLVRSSLETKVAGRDMRSVQLSRGVLAAYSNFLRAISDLDLSGLKRAMTDEEREELLGFLEHAADTSMSVRRAVC